eukprot:gnl/MRDRNA2_/MRDRNA2_142286_c0_seq1.p1 gnl/MRDRNA2_/MRDRNA2_142286_c0~~gnl/MRDRNA2_/MRDRNA2_142286_c0_seq1.p1  ORF type:complete len:484 (-),score=88.48 gnl/MRDRNA2_/MRDRNA2_142286_c0_seq1:190-1641(-)
MASVEPLLKPDERSGSGHGHGHAEGHGHSHGDECCQGHGHGGTEASETGHGHAGHSHDGDGHSHGGTSCCGEHGNEHGHGHGHGHGHSHDNPKEPSKSEQDISTLKKAIHLATFFMFAEIVGGILANSLAIITDATHLLSDVGGFIISVWSIELTRKAATLDASYGYQQAEILGALVSVLVIWFITGALLLEAVHRLIEPEAIDGKLMFIISTLGLVINLALMQVLGHSHGHGGHGHSHGGGCHGHGHGGSTKKSEGGHGHGDGHGHGHGHDEEAGHAQGHDTQPVNHDEEERLAMRAAFIHVVGDLIQSAGVMLAGLLIWYQPFDLGVTDTGVSKWCYADPVCTLLFCVLVMLTTIGTAKQAVRQLMMTTPLGIHPGEVLQTLQGIQHVQSVHDLHVWAVGSSKMISAHVVIDASKNCTQVLETCIKLSESKHGISHATFQLEVHDEFDHSIESLKLGEGSCHEVTCDPKGNCAIVKRSVAA